MHCKALSESMHQGNQEQGIIQVPCLLLAGFSQAGFERLAKPIAEEGPGNQGQGIIQVPCLHRGISHQ